MMYFNFTAWLSHILVDVFQSDLPGQSCESQNVMLNHLLSPVAIESYPTELWGHLDRFLETAVCH